MFWPTQHDLARRLHVLEIKVKELEIYMALNFAALQDAVASLSADVKALITLVPVAGADAANQAQIDAVTASLSSLDAAVKAAEPAPAAAPTGATGVAVPAVAPTGATGA